MNQTVFKVSELTNQMRDLMERSYPEVWIEGELSSLSTPASGHLYFSLKDERSQLRCAMFKSRVSACRYKPKVGDLVRVRAKISVYAARGDLQCIIQHIEDAGEGLLQRRYEELKLKLHQEGLFDPKYKRTLPSLPNHIGVITSPSGAAIRDVVSTLKRRCPGIPITIYPAVVQGDTASESLIQALHDANLHRQADVLILCRGGGSLEDLWCFNSEKLAQAIFESRLPIVSGVGHEVDITICDMVADVRAPTPTAAAELVSPDNQQLFSQLKATEFRLTNAIRRNIENLAQSVDLLNRHLRHPKQTLRLKNDRLMLLETRLFSSARLLLRLNKSRSDSISLRLLDKKPVLSIKNKQRQVDAMAQRLARSQLNAITMKQRNIESIGNQLNTVSPLATLERGFSIVKDRRKNIVRSNKELNQGDILEVQFSEGNAVCEVLKPTKT